MTKKQRQYEVLKRASLFLKNNQREAQVAEILLQHHLHVSRSQFYAMMQDFTPANVIEAFEIDVKKHVETGIPVQHLLGYTYFYGRKFIVNEHVLIPRPETEELVEHSLKKAKQNDLLTIVDVGTGSGVIAITLALSLPNVTVFATDISKRALNVAKQNAKSLQAKVQFLHGDFLQPIIHDNKQIDMIVSNPPYIAKTEEMELSKTVTEFDPALALFADEQGLSAYKTILAQSKHIFKPGSLLAFEIGHQQGPAVYSLIKNTYSTSEIRIIQDINKKDRIVSAQI